MACACGHTKSKHNKRECTFSQCSCKKFRTVKEKPAGDDALVKLISESVEIKIDGEKLLEKFSEFAGKSSKNQPKKSDVEDRVEQHWTNIYELGRDYKQRIAEADEILKKDVPERHHINAWIEKGINLRLLDKAEQSLQCFENVLLKDKKNIKALTEKAKSYEDLSQYREATNCYEVVLDITGKDVDILNRIAFSHLQLSEVDVAISYLEKVLQIDERNVYALDNLGCCHRIKKQYNIALDYLKKSNQLEKEKDDVFASVEMLRIYDDIDDDDASLNLATQLIKDGNANSFVYLIAGSKLSGQAKYDDAIPLLKKSASLVYTSRVFNQIGFCYQRKKRYDLAILYYEKALDKEQIQSFSESAISVCNLGQCYYHFKEYQTALNNFDRALEINPKYTVAFYWKLEIYSVLEKFGEVIKNCDKHPEFLVDPDLVLVEDILWIKRKALMQMLQYDDAIECSNEMLDMNPSSKNYVWEGWILQLSGRLQDAKVSYNNAIKISPENDEGYSYMADALMEEKNFEDAIDYYKKAWDISKDDEMILLQGKAIKKIGFREESDEKMKESEAIFDSILKSAEYGGEAWLEKGNCNWNLKKYGIAEDCWLTASEIIPKDASVWLNLGDVRHYSGSYNEALLFYEKSLLCDNSEQNIAAWYGKASAYKDAKQWSKAIEYYNEVLRLDNNFGDAVFYKAICYGTMKKYADAIDQYVNFIDKFPKDENVVNAWMYKAWSENYLKKYDEALESCKKALDLATENTNKTIDKDVTWDLYFIFQEKGRALEELKQYDDAIKCYKKLLKDSEEDIFPLKCIIRCLGELGKISEQKDYRNRLNKLEDDET